MRRRYPPGTEVTLNSMEGESHMPPGLKGKVDMVDDAGQIHGNWENGSSLALVPGVDSFHITDLPSRTAWHLVGSDPDCGCYSAGQESF